MPHTQENSGCFEILETLGRLIVTQESFKIKKKTGQITQGSFLSQIVATLR